jgi:hypothetical protein
MDVAESLGPFTSLFFYRCCRRQRQRHRHPCECDLPTRGDGVACRCLELGTMFSSRMENTSSAWSGQRNNEQFDMEKRRYRATATAIYQHRQFLVRFLGRATILTIAAATTTT